LRAELQKQQSRSSFVGWGNARDAIALWKSILNHRANRVVDKPESAKTIDESDVAKAFDEMIAAR
jgi:hypothetical protein